MTAEPNRQPEGIPIGGQFAAKLQSDDVVTLAVALEPSQKLGRVLSDRYFAAKAQMEAHDQNEWVRDVHEDFPEAAYAKVNIENDGGGRYTAGVDLYAADGTPIDLDSNAEAILEEDFDTGWDMFRHKNDEARALFGTQDEVFSLKSIQDSWAEIESSTEAPSDPFGHLTGVEKAKVGTCEHCSGPIEQRSSQTHDPQRPRQAWVHAASGLESCPLPHGAQFAKPAEESADPFAHLTGMDKARAQGTLARELSSEAAAAYVEDISAKLLAANPASARLYFNRRADVESGLTFDMDRVEDMHRNAVDVDLSGIEDTTFQDEFLDGHLDHDEKNDELYLNLDPGK